MKKQHTVIRRIAVDREYLCGVRCDVMHDPSGLMTVSVDEDHLKYMLIAAMANKCRRASMGPFRVDWQPCSKAQADFMIERES